MFGIDVDSRIPEKHLVRYVSDIIDNLDLRQLYTCYSEEGSPAYHPKMMLKVVIYAYMNGIYTCRKIAKAVRENINFIWLSGDSAPNFRTINTFCWTRCKDILADIFTQVVIRAHELGYLEFDNCFVDGTTFRASAGKYSYVWKKNVIRYREQVNARVSAMLEQIEAINADEQQIYGDKDLNELGLGQNDQARIDLDKCDSQQISQRLDQQEDRLQKAVELLKHAQPSDKQSTKKLLSALRKIQNARKKELPKLQGYEEQLEGIGDYRNSYSKTDNDATFIKMKDGSIAPGYVSSISTNAQFVTGVHLYNSSRETREFPVLIDQFHGQYNRYPALVVGDAAYGTANNLHYVEQREIVSYLKPQDYKIDYRDTALTDLTYDQDKDVWICEQNKQFTFVKAEIVTDYEHKREVRKYTCKECLGCSQAAKCIRTKDKSKRDMTYDPYLTPLRQKTVANLRSEDGNKLIKKRGIEPEAVFAFVKWNRKFSRFTVKSLRKCRAQLTMIFLGHNIGKMYQRSMMMVSVD